MVKTHKTIYSCLYASIIIIIILFFGLFLGSKGVFAATDCSTLTSSNINDCCKYSNGKLDCKRLGITSINTGVFRDFVENSGVVILELDLSYNELSNLNFLTQMSKLDKLLVSNNKIDDISIFSSSQDLFPNLTKLYLQNNNINNILSIKSLTKLETLNLSNNDITDISDLIGLIYLKNLYLSNNNITTIPNLPQSLESLWLTGNQINTISTLNSLKNFKTLYLQNNNIKTISDISGLNLSNMVKLDISNNCIDTDDDNAIISKFNGLMSNRFMYSNQRICSNWTGNDVNIIFSGLNITNGSCSNYNTGYYCILSGNQSGISGSSCSPSSISSGTSVSFNCNTGMTCEHTLLYHFEENGNICGSGIELIQIDKKAPSCNITQDSPISGNIYRPRNKITLTLNGNDEGIGIIPRNGYMWFYDIGEGIWEGNKTGIYSNGIYTGYIKDRLGNINKTGCSISISNIDTTPPAGGSCIQNSCFSGDINVSCREILHEEGSGWGGSYIIYTTGNVDLLNCDDDSQKRTSGSFKKFSETTYLKIAVCDEAGNMTTGSYNYTRDRAPITTISGYESTSGFNKSWTGNNIFVKFNIDEYDDKICQKESASTTYYCLYDEGDNECTDFNSGNIVEIPCNTGEVCKRIIKYYSVNSSGFIENVNTGSIWIDKQAPHCEINSIPNTGEYTSGNILLIANSNDGNGIGNVIYNWTGEYGIVDTMEISENSGYTLSVKDDLGNETGCSIVVSNIDRYIPYVSIAPISSSSAKKSHNITISLLDSGYAGFSKNQIIKYYWSNTNFCSSETSDYNLEYNFNNNTGVKSITGNISKSNGDGYKYLCILGGISDRAGNKSDSISGGAYLFDNTGPTGNIQISYNGDRNYASGTIIHLNLTGYDEYSNISKMSFSCNNTDRITEDFSGSKDFDLNNNIGCTTDNGRKIIYVKYIDSLGNTGDTVSGSIILDTIAPECNIIQASCTSGNLLITLTGNEPILKPAGWNGSSTGTSFTKLVTQNGSIQVNVYDIAGNQAMCNGEVTNYDTTGANIIVQDYETYECRDLEINVTGYNVGCSDGDLYYSFVNTPGEHIFQSSNKYTISGNNLGTIGTRLQKVMVKDNLGNISEKEFKINTIDSEITINSGNLIYNKPISGTKLLYNNLILYMGVNDGNCGSGTISITGDISCTEGSAIWSGYGIQVTPPLNNEGTGICTVKFSDDEGNIKTGTITYEFDTKKPNPAVCTQNSCFSDNINVTCNGTNNIGSKIVYTTDLTSPNCNSAVLNGNISFNKTTTLKVAVCDSIGNISSGSEYKYILNNIPPLTTIHGLPNGWTGRDFTVTLSGENYCEDFNVNTFYCIDESNSCDPTITGNTIDISCDTGTCEKYIRYYSKDGAGNIEGIKTNEIKIDKQPLTCSITGPNFCTNTGYTITLIASKPVNELYGWEKIDNRRYQKTINQNTTITGTVVDTHIGNTANCSITVNNIDTTKPTIVVKNLYTGLECNNITVDPIITDIGGCSGSFTYLWNNINGNSKNIYNGSNDNNFGINSESFSVSDAAGNTSTSIIKYQWIEVPITGHDFNVYNVGTGITFNWKDYSEASAGTCETVSGRILKNGEKGTNQIIGDVLTYTPYHGMDGIDWFKLQISDGDSYKDIYVTLNGIDNEFPYIINFTGGFGNICTTKNDTTIDIIFNEAVTGINISSLTGEYIKINSFTGELNKYSWNLELSGLGTGKVWLITSGITDLGRNNLDGESEELILGYYDGVGPSQPILSEIDETITSSKFKLEWGNSFTTGCADISEYLIEICSDENMNDDCIFYTSTINEKEIVSQNGTYYRRVFAIDSNNTKSETGNISQFNVDSQDINCFIKEINECSSGDTILELSLNITGTIINSGGVDWHKVSNLIYTGKISHQDIISGITVQDSEDKIGLCNELIITKFDNNSPITTLSGFVDDWNANDVYIEFSVIDSGCAGDTITKYCIGDGCIPNEINNNVTITCEDGSTCEKTLRYYSIDSVGNEESIKENIIKIDKQAPICEIINSNGESTKDVIILSVSGYDVGAGLDLLPYKRFSENRSNESEFIISQNGEFTAYIRDNVGNIGSCIGTVNNIDREPPQSAICTEDACFSEDKEISCNQISYESGNYIVYTTDGTTPTCSSRMWKKSLTFSMDTTLKVAVCDKAGNISTGINSYLYIIDNISPETFPSTSIQGWTGNDVHISLNATDGGCEGDITTHYCVYNYGDSCNSYNTGNDFDITCPSGQICKKMVEYYSIDNVGNQETTKTGLILIDKQAPSCILSGNTLSMTSGDIIVKSYSDDGDGVGNISYKWSGNPERTTINQIQVNQTGIYNVHVKDDLGNETGCSISVLNIDKIPPKQALCNTNNSCFKGNSTISCYEKEHETGNYIVYTLNDYNPTCDSTHWTGDIIINDNTTLNIAVCDEAGNISTGKKYVYNLDNIAPKTTIGGVSSGRVGENVLATFNSDGNGCNSKNTTYYCIDTGNSCEPQTPGNSVSITCNQGDSCIKYIRYYSIDGLGNKEEIQSSIVKIDKTILSCSLDYNIKSCTNSGIIVTLSTSHNVGSIDGWNKQDDKIYTKIVDKNGAITQTVTGDFGQIYTCNTNIKNIDTDTPVVQVQNEYLAQECHNIKITANGMDTGCGSGKLTYLWDDIPGSNTLTLQWDLHSETNIANKVNLSVKDNAGNKTSKTISYKWIDVGLTLDSDVINLRRFLPEGETYITTKDELISSFGVKEGDCGTGNISISGGFCDGAIFDVVGPNVIITSINNDNEFGQCEINFSDDEGNIKVGKIIFSKKEEKINCLYGWNLNNFINNTFWDKYNGNNDLGHEQLVCAIFGGKKGEKTAYTAGWNNDSGHNNCLPVDIRVIETGDLPSVIPDNTIYVINSDKLMLTNAISIGNCSAIVSKSNTTLYSTRKIDSDGMIFLSGNNIVIENINIDGYNNGEGSHHEKNEQGITTNLNSENISINNTKSFNHNGNGIDIQRGNSYVILNNIMTYNNRLHGISISNSSYFSINNTLSFNNDGNGIYLQKANNGIINNVQTNNNYGIGIVKQNGNGIALFNDVLSYNDGAGVGNNKTDSYNASRDVIVNPIDIHGQYLINWSDINTIGATGDLHEIRGYSFGSNVKTQVQPKIWNGFVVSNNGDFYDTNFIGSNTKKAQGDIQATPKSGNKLSITPSSDDFWISTYSVFGDIEKYKEQVNIGKIVDVILNKANKKNSIIVQLLGSNYFATHYVVYGTGVAGTNDIIDNTNTDTNTNTHNSLDWYDGGNQFEIQWNGFSREMNNAYRFAYTYGITTMDSINSANMNGPLTRIAMAKMLSSYAINVLGISPDTSRTDCSFIDVPYELDHNYNYGVVYACQLGIMGQNMPENKFRPNDTLTRAEFATALSRLLYKTEDGTTYYYLPHLTTLKSKGILTNTDPDLKETRGYVMLMLMRYVLNEQI